jgi:D123
LWPELHDHIRATVAELGGKVLPKLNWSAPKDATWISPTNDMECRTPNEIYLLLKSSDFVTHDLEQAFHGCVPDQRSTSIPYVLVLRKSFNLNPSLEFRCFVRNRSLIAVSQREMNYFSFLFEMRPKLLERIQSLLRDDLLASDYFSDPELICFVFDVYIPPPHDRVWLIDINPWAPRTDPLLFSWLELLTLPDHSHTSSLQRREEDTKGPDEGTDHDDYDIREPEFRLVGHDDPEAYQFSSTKYSAHKLPKDVVDASMGAGGSGGMEEMMKEWNKALEKQVEEDEVSDGEGKGWESIKPQS